MAYKALYRTYRPADFSEIAGQEHITRTFKNALKSNKLAHAYLFSGPRGTGKTSIAKIIAKAVNCEKAPIENPCNECDICKGIDNNTINDVIEIDAASNNGVDEIREIRDKVKYLPGVGRFKVYIIDEVHMLSTGAFNALLKTLEEPPKHVIFILATTEPHKIPATIHSRCQRFDFRGVSIPEMIHRLNTIIDEENIQISEQAIKVISESAEGGMRDAISLLDQVVSYSNDKVTADDVHTIRGTVSNERLLDIAQSIYQNNSVEAIKILDELIDTGKESKRLIDNLIMFYRDMLIYKNTDVSEEAQIIFSNKGFIELSKSLSNHMIFYYIDVLSKTQNDIKWSNSARLYVELALIKMVDKVDKQEIIFQDEINRLHDEIQSLKTMINEPGRTTIETPKTETKSDSPVSLQAAMDEQDDFDTHEEVKEEAVSNESIEEPVTNDTLFGHEVEQTDKPKTDLAPEVEPVVETIKQKPDETVTKTKETVQEESIKTRETQGDDTSNKTPYKTYDIRIVEAVLNDGNREEKIAMNKKWFDIERVATTDNMSLAKMITDGRIVATNGEMIIVEYPNASLCNRMMKPNFKAKVVEMLSDYYKKPIDYLALPKSVWQEKSIEFINKWKEDPNRYITLSEIEHPRLKEIPVINREDDSMEHQGVKEASRLYGKHKVKVKRGE